VGAGVGVWVGAGVGVWVGDGVAVGLGLGVGVEMCRTRNKFGRPSSAETEAPCT
jgi:hypothetical protein